MDFPESIDLAQRPTPLHEVPRWPRAGSGVRLFVKRDDLTGSALSGNKIRKLEFSIAEGLREGAQTLVTCGGAQSNHCRATALLAARLGLGCVLLLRRAVPEEERLDGNLLLSRMAGAEVRFISHDQWADRMALMAAVSDELAREGRAAYVIPEGASNAIGSLGYVRAWKEIAEQAAERGLEFDRLVHATGSGGTTAGLILGRAIHGGEMLIDGVAICDDREYFVAVIRTILREAEARFGECPHVPDADIRIIEGYVGLGYAKNTPEELGLMAELTRQSGLVLDPVYSGKAFCGLVGEIDAGRIPAGSTVLFLHTGGIYGWFPKREELSGALAAG